MARAGACGISDHYTDRILSQSPPRLPDTRKEFHGAAFARSVAEARHRLQLSTRDVARRAGISQAYVVALERARAAGGEPSPTPTVDVVARLAFALGLDPLVLVASGLRSAGRHVLCVVEDARLPIVNRLRDLAGRSVDTWVAARPAGGSVVADGSHPLRLRRGVSSAYEPTAIAASLGRELKRLAPVIDGANIGCVFAEMSEVMTTLEDARSVIAFEDSWDAVVANAAAKFGAHAEWNVCVYEISALRALPDPVGSVTSLVRTHDTVLAFGQDRVATGSRSVRHIVAQLRPPTQSVRAWRATTDHLAAEDL
jgi:transcriptional regulator with XRE-family HTH domain